LIAVGSTTSLKEISSKFAPWTNKYFIGKHAVSICLKSVEGTREYKADDAERVNFVDVETKGEILYIPP
jgi:hypothetical protein